MTLTIHEPRFTKKSYDAISRQDWRAAEQNLRRLCKGAKAQASDSDIFELFLSVACKTGHWETAGQLLARAQPSPKNVAEMYRVQCELRKLTLSKQYKLINDNAGPDMLRTITKVSSGVLPFRIG